MGDTEKKFFVIAKTDRYGEVEVAFEITHTPNLEHKDEIRMAVIRTLQQVLFDTEKLAEVLEKNKA